MTPAPTPNKTEKKVSSLATPLAYIQRMCLSLGFITFDLFLDFYIYLYWIFRDKKIVERLFAYVQRQWRLLALVTLYIFFRPTFEGYIASLLESFEPSVGSFVIWLLLIVIALVYTYILSRRRYVLSEGLRAWTIVMFTGWAYYRFVGTTHYVATPTLIPSTCYMDLFLILCVCVAFIAGWSHWMRRKSKKEVADNSRAGYHVEHPRRSGDKDLLGRLEEAEALAEKVFQTNTSRGAFTLGLTSPWGAGKTSFMLVMKEYLEIQHDEKIIVIEFNPWRYRKAPNLTQIFFEELSRALAPYNSALSTGFVHYVDHLLAKDSNPWLQLASRLLPQESSTKSTGEQYDFLTREISKLGRKIFIFIDDVDRLEREELVELFALVRNSSSFPCMSYILAYDKEYVASQLKGCFDQHTYRYMEKVVQEEYALAQITPEQIERALKLELERMGHRDLWETLVTSRIQISHHLPTIRAVKRICNTLSSRRKELERNVILFDWFILELIRTQYPILFDFLRVRRKKVFKRRGEQWVIDSIKRTAEELVWVASPPLDDTESGTIVPFSRYLSEHYDYFQIKNVALVTELVMALWGRSRTVAPLQANHIDYIGRYFYGTLCASEIDEGEFRRHIALPFDEIKEYVKQKINLKQKQDLYCKIKREHADSREKAEKLLRTVFYLASSRWSLFTRTDFDDQVKELNSYLKWEDRKSKLMEIFEQPDIRLGVLLYLIMATRYIEEPSFDDYKGEELIILPFSSEELDEKKVRLFMKYLAEHKSRNLGFCYLLWRECRTLKPTRQQNRGGEPLLEPVVCHPEMDKEMKQAIQENLEAVIPYFIAWHRSSPQDSYVLLSPEPNWGRCPDEENLEGGSFCNFIDRQDGDSSPVIKEFQEFLKRWIENKDRAQFYNCDDEDPVVVGFRFNHIEPKGREFLFRDEDCKPWNWPED